MLKSSVAPFGPDERSHGLSGLEEDEESGGGDLGYGYEGRVFPCLWIRSETVRQVGEGGCVVARHVASFGWL